MGMPAVEAPAYEVHPQSTPDLQLEIGAPEPADAPPLPPELPVGTTRWSGAPTPPPVHPDRTQDVSLPGLSLGSLHEPPPGPPGEAGYVDLFADSPEDEPAPAEDPFAAAARASLPKGFGAPPAPDPFAPLREQLKTPDPEPLSPSATKSASPKVPHIPKGPQQRSATPVILIGAGGLVLVGILAFVLLGGKKPPPAAGVKPEPVAAQAAAPAPQPPVVPAPPPPPVAQASPPIEPAPVAVAAAAAPKPDRKAAEDDRRAREDRQRERDDKAARDRDAKAARDREAKAAREREAKDARERDRDAREAKAARDRDAKAAREAKAREDREARERDKEAREARAREEREAKERDRQRRESEKVASANLSGGDEALGQDQIQKVLSSTRKAFESCIVSSGRTGEIKLDGRRVLLRLNIQNNGAVTYPTLDDVTLNGTDLGSCLKGAARLMVFPKFKGDTMHVEVPLVLAGG
jgi:hypothetical protein